MSRVAIICLRVVIGAMSLEVALFSSMAAMMVVMFHVFLGPFISMARDISSEITGTPLHPPHRSFLLLKIGIILAVAIGMFVSVVAPRYKRLLHAVAIGILIAVFFRPWQQVAHWVAIYYLVLVVLWSGFYLFCLTRAEPTRLNRPG